MQFNAISLASLLAFSGLAASQVVVTVTSTVTVRPPTTSTVTQVVTVTQGSSTWTTTSKSKTTKPASTSTVVVTSTAPPDPNTTKCPAPLYYPCRGVDIKCNTCEKGLVCKVQNDVYSQCVKPEDA